MGMQARCGSGHEIIENKLSGSAALRRRLLEGLQSLRVGLLRALRPLPDRVAESCRVCGSFLKEARYIQGRASHKPYSPATGGPVDVEQRCVETPPSPRRIVVRRPQAPASASNISVHGVEDLANHLMPAHVKR